MESRRPAVEQKRRALVTGLVLAAMALGVYLVLMLQVAARA